MEKTIPLKNLLEIVEVVNSKNIDNFLIDFGNWLNFQISIKETTGFLETMGVKIEKDCVLNWIDDGKNEEHITIKVVSESEETKIPIKHTYKWGE